MKDPIDHLIDIGLMPQTPEQRATLSHIGQHLIAIEKLNGINSELMRAEREAQLQAKADSANLICLRTALMQKCHEEGFEFDERLLQYATLEGDCLSFTINGKWATFDDVIEHIVNRQWSSDG